MTVECEEIPGITIWYRQMEFFLQWKNAHKAQPVDHQDDASFGCRPNEYYPTFFHNHAHYEIYILLQGEATLNIEEYGYNLRAHDLMIIPPERMHRVFSPHPDQQFERMFIYVSRPVIANLGSDNFSMLHIIDDATSANEFIYHLTDEEFQLCQRLFMEILYAPDNTSPAGALRARCRFIMLLSHICQTIANGRVEPARYASNLVGKAIAYINAHFTEPITLETVAQALFISKFHLSREFKSYAFISVGHYIQSKRLSLAKQLLRQGISPSDVSRQCGFQDYSSFFRIFSRETGHSPRDYCKVAQSDDLC